MKNSWKIFLAFSAALGMLSSMWIFWDHQTNIPALKASTLVQSPKPAKEPLSKTTPAFRRNVSALLAPASVDIPDENLRGEHAPSADFSSDCLKFLKALRQQDFRSTESTLAALSGLAGGKPTGWKNLCTQAPKWTQDALSLVASTCPNLDAGCVPLMHDLRFKTVAYLLADFPLEKINDETLLVEKYFGEISLRADGQGLALTAGQLGTDAIRTGERIRTLNRDSLVGAQLVVAGYLHLFDAARNDGKLQEALLPDLEKAIAALKNTMPPEDNASALARHLVEIDLFAAAQHKDPLFLEGKAKAANASYPQFAWGPYYEALAAYRKGDRGTAIAQLKEALTREPNFNFGREALLALEGDSPSAHDPFVLPHKLTLP